MGVLLQAFYDDCPNVEQQEFTWWNFIKEKIASLSAVGFTALWLPPANKAASLSQMGYDTYDYYDLGEHYQKGAIKTRFGLRSELEALITTAHAHNLQVYADLVFHQNSGADDQEINPFDGKQRWTKFTPKSKQFFRTYEHFQPSKFETIDGLEPISFGEMPNLCHRHPEVYTQLLAYARWLLEKIDFDGFRYDCVKGYGAWMVRSIQELRCIKNGAAFTPFGVGECWTGDYTILEWLKEANTWSDNPCRAFDFPLRDKLKALCDSYGYSLNGLKQTDTVLATDPALAVTFVDNHDTASNGGIINDKMLAYSFILTHQGYPCVFWQDYFNWNLAQEGNNGGIAALIYIHEKYASGETDVLHCDDNLYIMQRRGASDDTGLVYVLNNLGEWNGNFVTCKWSNRKFIPFAWRGKDNTDVPEEKYSDINNIAEFWAPPRGYAVYIPI